MELQEARDISIKDYLEQRGVRVEKAGRKWFCSSPFSRDSNWSFAIYPNNTFYCWSTGKGGDIIKLVQYLEGLDFKSALKHLEEREYKKYQVNYKKFKEDEDFWKDFDYTKYLTHDDKEKAAIISYGASRSIRSGFDCGVYFTRNFESNTWVRNPSLMFPHQDKDGNVIGAKFRSIPNDDGSYNSTRFSMRGRPGFYILNTNAPETFQRCICFLSESETSTNSLWSYLRDKKVPATVLCVGGVSSAPKEIPDKYKDREVRLVIDYDGDEKLYQERLKLYEHLNVKPIKIILPKGEDINSLYHNGEMWKIESLLI